MLKHARHSLTLFALLCSAALSSPADAAPWQIVGVGNATCKDWNNSMTPAQREILSWMTGYISAENLRRSDEKRPSWKLEQLDYEYLRGKIDAVCLDPTQFGKKMHGILFDQLLTFPRDEE